MPALLPVSQRDSFHTPHRANLYRNFIYASLLQFPILLSLLTFLDRWGCTNWRFVEQGAAARCCATLKLGKNSKNFIRLESEFRGEWKSCTRYPWTSKEKTRCYYFPHFIYSSAVFCSPIQPTLFHFLAWIRFSRFKSWWRTEIEHRFYKGKLLLCRKHEHS